jgi:hypothetical protein
MGNYNTKYGMAIQSLSGKVKDILYQSRRCQGNPILSPFNKRNIELIIHNATIAHIVPKNAKYKAPIILPWPINIRMINNPQKIHFNIFILSSICYLYEYNKFLSHYKVKNI